MRYVAKDECKRLTGLVPCNEAVIAYLILFADMTHKKLNNKNTGKLTDESYRHVYCFLSKLQNISTAKAGLLC